MFIVPVDRQRIQSRRLLLRWLAEAIEIEPRWDRLR
jgi:hypothetical protein